MAKQKVVTSPTVNFMQISNSLKKVEAVVKNIEKIAIKINDSITSTEVPKPKNKIEKSLEVLSTVHEAVSNVVDIAEKLNKIKNFIFKKKEKKNSSEDADDEKKEKNQTKKSKNKDFGINERISELQNISEKIKNSIVGKFVQTTFTDTFNQIKSSFQINKLLSFDKGSSNSLFSHIQEQARNSVFGVNQIQKSYEKFLKSTKDTGELDKLSEVTQRLGVFNYFDGGMDGATSAVEGLLSGNSQEIASLLGMTQSAFENTGIQDIFASGNVTEGINQLQTLMDQMGYTEEAANNMAQNPIIKWNAFTEQIKTRFSNALTTILEKILELSEAGVFDFIWTAFDGILSIVDFLVAKVVDFATYISDNWTTIGPIITTIGIALLAFVGVLLLAQGAMLILDFLAAIFGVVFASPLLLIIGLIMAVVFALGYWSGGLEAVMGMFFAVGAFIANIFIGIINIGLSFAEFFVNIFRDPVYAIKKLFVDLWNGLIDIFIAPFLSGIGYLGDMLGDSFIKGANIAIDGINWIIRALNLIPGVNIGELGHLDNSEKSFKDQGWELAQSWKLDAPTTNADVWTAPKMDYINYDDAFNMGSNLFNGTDSGFDGIPQNLSGINDGINTLPETMPGSLENPANMNEVDISEESIQLMRDVANMRFTQNFVSVTPDVKFGDVTVHETADYRRFADGLVNELEQGLQIAASGVHG